jgi:UDP-N-acetylglucosamine 4-epimerase
MSGRFRNTRRKGRKQSRKQQGGNFESYEGLTILVTGGAGFIGSNLVDALLEAGAAKVRVLDNFVTGKESNLDNARTFGERFELMRGDIRKMVDCEAACKDVNIVFHEAAMVSVPMSMDKPLENHETNITGTLNMLIAAANAGVKRFVYASSAATYGMDETLPKVETMTRHYPSPYALSKGVDEDYAKLWAYKEELGKGMTTVGLRYFNVYGPRQDPKSPYSGVISIFADKIKTGQELTIFGDGSNTRDFVFVKDIVQGNMLSGLAILGPNEARVYNVGTGSAVSLLELKDTMERIFGTEVTVVKKAARPGDILHSLSNIDAIRTDLGYAPAYTLEEGLSILLLGK